MRRPAPAILVACGTRPEAVKLAPVVAELRARDAARVEVCVTGQHRHGVHDTLAALGLHSDTDLDVMVPGQSLAELSARLLAALDRHLSRATPDLVLVQGDTTTTLCAALGSFYRSTPVAHLEAGLRTGNPAAPFPEEMNRILVARVAALHLAPTARAADNLRDEGVPADRIVVTGNTVVDALHAVLPGVRASPPAVPCLDDAALAPETPVVVVTVHRREHLGASLESICGQLHELAVRAPSARFVIPVHPNPRVREPVLRVLSGVSNVRITEPLAYREFVRLLDRATLVLTDSGGIQEEAPSLGKPVLVMRDATDRPEAVEAGLARVVGASAGIVDAALELLAAPDARARMTSRANPFGDGCAARRVSDAILTFLGR